jgi:Leucine-rich repeat (LRR) protein
MFVHQSSLYSDPTSTDAGLKFLCLRQNLIKDASAIGSAQCKDTLEELYFNDNQLTEIPDLTGFKKLRRLEFSYNHEVSIAFCRRACCLMQIVYTNATYKQAVVDQRSYLGRPSGGLRTHLWTKCPKALDWADVSSRQIGCMM